jgi:hypothetical protein
VRSRSALAACLSCARVGCGGGVAVAARTGGLWWGTGGLPTELLRTRTGGGWLWWTVEGPAAGRSIEEEDEEEKRRNGGGGACAPCRAGGSDPVWSSPSRVFPFRGPRGGSSGQWLVVEPRSRRVGE